jgi:anti-sigma regulatory factor (Ser/Thr protein kinase)
LVLKINNDFDDLRAAVDSVRQLLKSNHAPSEVIFAANLAIEEIVTNIINYGYDDDLTREIALRPEVTENLLIIEISDDGTKIQSFRSAEADILRPSEEPRIGGLGVRLVRKHARPLRIRPP